MFRYVLSYAAPVIAGAALDFVWLGVVAKPLYQSSLGHLLATRPNFIAAGLFYLVFGVGVMVFVLLPHLDGAWGKTLITAALFGFFTYAVYDFTNLATLRDWPVAITVIDICWGIFISLAATAFGKFVLDRIA